MMVLPLHSRHLTRALSCTHLNSRCLVGTLSNSSSSSPEANKEPPATNFSWPFPDFNKSQKYWEFKSRITCFLVGIGGRTFLTVFNRTKVHNRDILIDAVYRRKKGVPLITVANHESCLDDPGLFGVALSPKQLADQKNMRWSLAAHDICFTRPAYSSFFSLGKCIPIVRGLGVYQRPVDFAIERLNSFGDWLHIFPEGKVNMERTKLYRLKWGVGRIISELQTTPIVIPFHHTGMADVLPTRSPYIPRIGKKVFVNIGHPLNIQPVLDSIKDVSPHDKRKIVTDFIQCEMEKLRHATLKLSEDYLNGNLKS